MRKYPARAEPPKYQTQLFIGQMSFLLPNQPYQSSEGKKYTLNIYENYCFKIYDHIGLTN